MWVLKYRIGYVFLVLFLAAMLFTFSMSGLFWMLLLLAGLALLLALLIQLDARHFDLYLRIPSGGQIGKPVLLQFVSKAGKHFLVAGAVKVELEASNTMTGEREIQEIQIPLWEQQKCYETDWQAAVCGEVVFRCTKVEIRDILGLFRVKCKPFRENRLTVYPEKTTMKLILSQNVAGSGSTEGKMQNKSGNDQREMFDIREYIPGDDIRSIHWKLSSKTENLILRQPSKPFEYDFALMPDFGRQTSSGEEINLAASLVISFGERLLAQGVHFCMLIPGNSGIQLREVHSRSEWYQLLPQWLGVQIPLRSGSGMQFFQAEHMEQYFSRLILFSAGSYEDDVRRLGNQIAVTAIRIEKEAKAVSYTALEAGSEMVVFPAERSEQTEYKIIC